MSDIELHERYPLSRREDITDAYMRGFEYGRKMGRRTTTRHGKFRTKYGRSVPCCECCGYGIGDARWHYCPSCGAKVVDE